MKIMWRKNRSFLVSVNGMRKRHGRNGRRDEGKSRSTGSSCPLEESMEEACPLAGTRV